VRKIPRRTDALSALCARFLDYARNDKAYYDLRPLGRVIRSETMRKPSGFALGRNDKAYYALRPLGRVIEVNRCANRRALPSGGMKGGAPPIPA